MDPQTPERHLPPPGSRPASAGVGLGGPARRPTSVGIGALARLILVAIAAAGLAYATTLVPRHRPNAAAAGGYPPPVPSPTPTPAPDGAGRFPPPGVPHVLVGLEGSPHAEILIALRDALAAQDVDGLSSWSTDGGPGLALEYPGETEGFGTHLPPADLADLLGDLFSHGSAPVIQGYFGAHGCAVGGPEPCSAIVVTTGWSGPVPMPTRSTVEPLGPMPPDDLPTGAAAWAIAADVAGPYWTAWWMGDGYYALLEALAAQGHGTYHVVR